LNKGSTINLMKKGSTISAV